MNKKKLAVLFPGKRYSCELPLLYMANCIYRDSGYEVLNLTYPDMEFDGKPDKKIYRKIMESVVLQAEEAGINSCADAVFISKSMGTVAAGILEEKVKVPVRHIYLTPLAETFPYMGAGHRVFAVAQGTKDKWLEPETLLAFCRKEGLRLVRFEGVGHRLEMPGNMLKSLDNFRTIAELYYEDIAAHN